MPQPPPIEVSSLERRYGDVQAVRGLHFALDNGVVGLLGPNGAGKSTTLQMLAGTLAPSAGTVKIGGVDLLTDPHAAKRQIGFLPDPAPLYREQTVDELLRFCAELRNIPRDQRQNAVTKAKTRTGLEAVGERLIGNLSRGYQQRVGIAQALVHQPRVIILDEPTAGLDPNQIREIRALLRELGEDHCVLLSTHILAEVQAICGRVLLLHQGTVVLDQDLRDLRNVAECAHRIRLQTTPDVAELDAIRAQPGIHSCALNDTHLLLKHDGTDETIDAAISALMSFGLRELVPVQTNLEELFVELTLNAHSKTKQADIQVASNDKSIT